MAIFFFFCIDNIRQIARLFPTVHYALNLRDAARNEFERNMERRYNLKCRRKPKCSEKTCTGQVWIKNQIHIQLWPDRESNLDCIGERHGNNRCTNLPAQIEYLMVPREMEFTGSGKLGLKAYFQISYRRCFLKMLKSEFFASICSSPPRSTFLKRNSVEIISVGKKKQYLITFHQCELI